MIEVEQRPRWPDVFGVCDPYQDPRLRCLRDVEVALDHCLFEAWFMSAVEECPYEGPAPSARELAALLREAAQELEDWTECPVSEKPS
jgi:hypothetical protein